MKLSRASFHALKIPFVEAFSHAAQTRGHSDSIIVRLMDEDGIVGYGEAVPRPYVTGETVDASLSYMKDALWPKVAEVQFSDLPEGDPIKALSSIEEALLTQESGQAVVWNACRAGFECAMIDCLLKRRNRSFSTLLPPKRQEVVYSGVITSGSLKTVLGVAERLKSLGITQVKVKVDGKGDRDRLIAIREVLGPQASIRLDANGAFSPSEAVSVLNTLSDLRIDCIEQPIARSKPSELAKLKAQLPFSIMVDESLVTFQDAQELIEARACDFFNLRVSKCGGVSQTLKLARLARQAGIRLQLGAHVGETAILSALGRHIAAYLENVEYVEGSFGTMLLTEDISRESIKFGQGGKAAVLHGPGLGISINEDSLQRFSVKTIQCGRVRS